MVISPTPASWSAWPGRSLALSPTCSAARQRPCPYLRARSRYLNASSPTTFRRKKTSISIQNYAAMVQELLELHRRGGAVRGDKLRLTVHLGRVQRSRLCLSRPPEFVGSSGSPKNNGAELPALSSIAALMVAGTPSARYSTDWRWPALPPSCPNWLLSVCPIPSPASDRLACPRLAGTTEIAGLPVLCCESFQFGRQVGIQPHRRYRGSG